MGTKSVDFDEILRNIAGKYKTSREIVAFLRSEGHISLPDGNMILYGNQFLGRSGDDDYRQERCFGNMYGYPEKIVVLFAETDKESVLFVPSSLKDSGGIVLMGHNLFPKDPSCISIGNIDDTYDDWTRGKYSKFVYNNNENVGRYGITHGRWGEMEPFLKKFLRI